MDSNKTNSHQDAADDKKPTIRVMLWSIQRTLSTVLEKCMSYVPKTQIIHEPYGCACSLGPEKVLIPGKTHEDYQVFEDAVAAIKGIPEFPMAFDCNQCTYKFVKSELEADYPDKQLVFCKDMASGISEKYDMLPKGYRHTFLIRNPLRTFPSQRKLVAMQAIWVPELLTKFRLCDLPPPFMAKKKGFQEQYELMKHLQENGDERDPIIIDADDLLTNPASILRQYCTQLGIPFTEQLLQWPADKLAMMSWKGPRQFIVGNFLQESGGFHDVALSSTEFHPLNEMPSRKDLAEDVLVCVDDSMPFYEKMHVLRIQPE